MIYLILVLGLIFRLISLDQSLWLDEATSALAAKMNMVELFTKFLPGDFHPPLYYLTLKLWSGLFGYSEIALRLPSIIFGVLTIYMVYLIGKSLFNKNVGLVASLFLATSGLHVYYSQEARMYSLATMLVALSIYFFLENKLLLFSIILIFIGMTDYVSLLILPVFLIVGYKNWKKVLFSFLPLIIVFISWMPTFRRQLFSGLTLEGSNWWNILGLPTFKNFALIPVKFILGRIDFDNKFIYGVIVIASFFIYGINILLRPCKEKPCKVVLAWLITPIVLGILLSFRIPTLSYFRFLFCLPAFYLLTAYGIEGNIKYRNMFIFLVIFINLTSTLYFDLNPHFYREDWRSAAKVIGVQKIIFSANSQKEALIYYGKGEQIMNISDLNSKDKEIWLSRYVWEIFDPKDSVRLKIESLGYNRTQELNFNGVVFYKYANSN